MKDILMEIKPDKKERGKIYDLITKFIVQLGLKNYIVGGSIGKGTWLHNNHDVDIFIQYCFEKDISDKLEQTIQKKFDKYERVHGSRDYFQIIYEGINFELVPVYKIKDSKKAKNITDVSPLHVGWVNNNVVKKDEVRLLKQFCKAQEVYGAETYIKGFSGYVLEILIAYYGTFNKVLRKSQTWKLHEIIDIEGKFKGQLNKSKISPLIVIDPVQADRNASAALSLEKFNKFKSVAKKYLNKPSKKYFKIKKYSLKDFKKHDLILKIEPLEGKRDIVGTKMLKVYEHLKKSLNREGFTVKKSKFIWGYVWFDLEVKRLKKDYVRVGPPASRSVNVEMFKNKHKKAKQKDGVWCVTLQRKYTTYKKFAEHLLKKKIIKEKVKKITLH